MNDRSVRNPVHVRRWHGKHILLISAACLLLAVACRDPSADRAQHHAERELPAVEVVRVGALDGADPTVLFGRVGGVEIDTDGNLYVLDLQAITIRVFGPDGRHVRDIGRRGAGPGEYVAPDGLVIGLDGRLWVRDGGAQRYATFALDGTPLNTYPGRFGRGRWEPVVGEEGLLWESATLSIDPETRQPGEREFRGKRPRDDTMETVRTVPVMQAAPQDQWQVGAMVGRDRIVTTGVVPVPYSASRRDAVDAGGAVWTGTTERMRLVQISPQGDTLRVVERPSEPMPIAAADKNRAISELTDRFGDALQVDEDLIPEYFPVWATFFVAPDGLLWVERFQPPESQMPRWEVHDPDEGYLGTLNVPIESTPRPAVRGTLVAGVVTDSLGVEHVAVFEVSAMGSGNRE